MPNDLWKQAQTIYPRLQGVDVGVVLSPRANSEGNMLESWPAGEPGTPDYPRPAELSADKFGVQIFDPKTSPTNLAADVVSHQLVNTDPVLKGQYQKFTATFQTPSMQSRLQQDYTYAKKNFGETRPFEDWAAMVRIPAYFRGYAFGQWDKKAQQKAFSTEQKDIMDQMVKYLKTPAVPSVTSLIGGSPSTAEKLYGAPR